MFAPEGGKRACGTRSAGGNPQSLRIHTPHYLISSSSAFERVILALFIEKKTILGFFARDKF